MKEHLVIPDTQVRPGTDIAHIRAAGVLAVARQPDVIVVIGDWWDFSSLSTHQDRGHIEYHNKSYVQDLEAGIAAMEEFLAPIEAYNEAQRANKKRLYKPRLIFTCGNHEYRRNRLEDQTPKLQGALPTPEAYLWDKGFEVYPYKQAVVVDGIHYCHLCPQPKSPGAVERPHLIANKRHSSWTVGHTQGWEEFTSYHIPRIQCLVTGSFYKHDEGYKEGSNDHFRGLVYKYVMNTDYMVYDYERISIGRLEELYG